eukprot:COSAG04_NODE_3619_length_2668_cov_1.533281_2_plen_459_part_00
MEAPLALHAQAEPELLPSDEPQQLPRELREELRRWMMLCVAGPFAPAKREEQRRRVRAWEALILAWAWCSAYTIYRGLRLVAPAAALALSGAVAALAAIFTLMAAKGSGGRYFEWNELLPRVLEELEGPVGSETAAALQGLAKGAPRKLFAAPLGVAIDVAIAYESKPDAAHQLAAAAVFVLGAVAVLVIGPGKEILEHATWALTEDKVELLGKRIRGTTAATADFDELTDGVYRAHLATTELSKLMESQTIRTVAGSGIVAAAMVVASVSPRPQQGYDCAPTWASNSTAAPMDPECGWYDVVAQYGWGSWYNLFCHQYVLAFYALFFSAGTGVAALFAPARVTTACQKVASAVNDLRVNALDDQPAKLATLEQGQRIEMLKRYISELNRDQGLGVLILKKRITFTLVMGMLIQTVSAMVVINTTLQSVLHDTEEEIAAVTAEESVIEAAEAALTGKG